MRSTPDWSDKTILIVEDEEINRFFYSTALQVTNANLLFAKDGREGIELFQNNNVDCILMDIRMPVLDGYEAIKRIKASNNDMPIIVQTAYALVSDQKKAFESGCDVYLAKPVRLNTLFSILEKYLGS